MGYLEILWKLFGNTLETSWKWRKRLKNTDQSGENILMEYLKGGEHAYFKHERTRKKISDFPPVEDNLQNWGN